MNLFMADRTNQNTGGSMLGGDENNNFALGLSPQVQIAIAFGVTLVVGFICAMSILPRLGPQPDDEPVAVEPTPDFSEPTAREAYPSAVTLIRETYPDAVLASTAGKWTPIVNETQMAAGRTGWTFFFYLPEEKEMAAVVVNRDGEARIADIESWETPPDLLDDARWQIDSPQAVDLLIQNCKEVLQEEVDTRIEARLTLAAENRTLMWKMKAASEDNPLAACEINVDAVTGLIRQ